MVRIVDLWVPQVKSVGVRGVEIMVRVVQVTVAQVRSVQLRNVEVRGLKMM